MKGTDRFLPSSPPVLHAWSHVSAPYACLPGLTAPRRRPRLADHLRGNVGGTIEGRVCEYWCGILTYSTPLDTREAAVTNHMSSGQIISDPAILAGKPVIAGTRISVQLILEKLRDGWTIDDLLDAYTHLTREQVVAALDYAADHLGASA